MSDDKSIDPKAIDALRELSPDTGSEFVRELIEIYLQDTPQRIAELGEALAKGDLPTFTRAAHTIKGSSSNFGANKLTKLAHELELQGKTGNIASASPSIQSLKAEYTLVSTELAKIAGIAP